MIGQRISAGKREKMAICSKCLHKEVCAFRKQTRDSCAESCKDFLGWVKVCDERPILLKDNVVISDYGLSFMGYYDYNKRDREHFCDSNTLEKIYECPSYWLKGLALHEQEKSLTKNINNDWWLAKKRRAYFKLFLMQTKVDFCDAICRVCERIEGWCKR